MDLENLIKLKNEIPILISLSEKFGRDIFINV